MGFKRIMSSLGAGREQKETEALVAWGAKGSLPGRDCEVVDSSWGGGANLNLLHHLASARRWGDLNLGGGIVSALLPR